MKKVIGIVGEGPIDQLTIKTAVDAVTGERNIYRNIQPEQDVSGEFGNGWKGVYRWCETNSELIPALFSDIVPCLDLLIIQMDGDVARKEKEVHCLCTGTECEKKGQTSPLLCQLVKNKKCPVQIPCPDHNADPHDYRMHLRKMLCELLGDNIEKVKIVIVIPCDNTDAWIVAAYDNLTDIETIADPWDHIISLKKEYHGIRIPGHKKSTVIFKQFMPVLAAQWKQVVLQCESAALFEKEIKEAVLEDF